MKRDTILIVDDVELNRAIMAELFIGQYDIEEAANGVEALAKLKDPAYNIKIVILDIIMPVMDGYETLRQMNKLNMISKMPVFVVTAEDDDKQLMTAYELGAVDVIRKPFNSMFLIRRVGNIIELYKNRERLSNIIAEQELALKKQAAQLEEQAQQLLEASSSIIDTLSTAIEFRDCESGEHVKRIRKLTQVMSEYIMNNYPEYGITKELIPYISDASAMHDVGKIAIPDYILNKPGRLTDEEYKIMKTHTVKGCELLNSITEILDSKVYLYSYDICRYHHERYDGRGYPDGLCGDAIPIWAQIVSVADVYDALVSERVYKKAYSHKKAVEMILNGECGTFGPVMLECLTNTADNIHEMFYNTDTAETAHK